MRSKDKKKKVNNALDFSFARRLNLNLSRQTRVYLEIIPQFNLFFHFRVGILKSILINLIPVAQKGQRENKGALGTVHYHGT